jgi:hypothetical protein
MLLYLLLYLYIGELRIIYIDGPKKKKKAKACHAVKLNVTPVVSFDILFVSNERN